MNKYHHTLSFSLLLSRLPLILVFVSSIYAVQSHRIQNCIGMVWECAWSKRNTSTQNAAMRRTLVSTQAQVQTTWICTFSHYNQNMSICTEAARQLVLRLQCLHRFSLFWPLKRNEIFVSKFFLRNIRRSYERVCIWSFCV